MRLAPTTAKDRVALRHIPKGYRPVSVTDVDAAIYIGESANSRTNREQFCAIAYRGTAFRSAWHYVYPTAQARAEQIAGWLEGERGHARRKAKRQLKRRAERLELKAGDILHYSWGYDQTNCEFWQVVKVTAKTATIREIGSRPADQESGCDMSGYLLPCPDQFIGPEIRRRCCGTKAVDMDFGCASLWDGRPMYSSWYA